MSGIKSLVDVESPACSFCQSDDFNMGEHYGRYAMGQELLPLLKAARGEVKAFLLGWVRRGLHLTIPVNFNQIATTLEGLETVIADIERPRETPKGATPEEIAQSIADMPF